MSTKFKKPPMGGFYLILLPIKKGKKKINQLPAFGLFF